MIRTEKGRSNVPIVAIILAATVPIVPCAALLIEYLKGRYARLGLWLMRPIEHMIAESGRVLVGKAWPARK
jgi:hypothetical protein